MCTCSMQQRRSCLLRNLITSDRPVNVLIYPNVISKGGENKVSSLSLACCPRRCWNNYSTWQLSVPATRALDPCESLVLVIFFHMYYDITWQIEELAMVVFSPYLRQTSTHILSCHVMTCPKKNNRPRLVYQTPLYCADVL